MGQSYEDLLIDSGIQLWCSFSPQEETRKEPEMVNKNWIIPIKFI